MTTRSLTMTVEDAERIWEQVPEDSWEAGAMAIAHEAERRLLDKLLAVPVEKFVPQDFRDSFYTESMWESFRAALLAAVEHVEE